MPYLNIHSRDYIKNYKGASRYPMSLTVLRDDGVQVTPSENVKVTDLKRNKKNIRPKHFLNAGDGGITFKVNVLIWRKARWNIQLTNANGKVVLNHPKYSTMLKKFYDNMTVLNVVTDFIDIPNGNYIITKNPSRTQTTEDYTVWELEFTTYRAINTVKYANNNTAVKKAIASTKKAQSTLSRKGVNSAVLSTELRNLLSGNSQKLLKCNLSQLKYSKKQKDVKCVRYMQKVLYKKGFLTKKQIDGWHGPKTKEAIKKFQKKYKKKYNLKVTGTVDKRTLVVLCEV